MTLIDNIQVDVSIACSEDAVPDEAQIAGWVRTAVAHVYEDSAVEVSVRIVDEREGATINERYREASGPTNVLSFPAAEPGNALPPEMPRMLGDIVICAPVVANEAEAQGKAPDAHWAHLLVHGALHLLGYDHAETEQAEAMESLEKQILAGYGITDPYAA